MDSGGVMQHQAKIQQLFDKFLEPDFVVRNDTYLSRLLTYFSAQENTVDTSNADLPVFAQWLVRAVTVWETNKTTPSSNIASFTLNLAGFVSKNESQFCALNAANIYTKLIHVVRARQTEAAPSIKLAYIKLLGSFLDHKSGVHWVVSSDLWRDVVKFSLTSQTIYITREGYRFVAKILEQALDYDDAFCHAVVKEVMSPLRENAYKSVKATDEIMEVSDENVYRNLSPTLQLVGDVLEYFLESVLSAHSDSRVVLIFLRDFHLEQSLCSYMMIAHNKYLVYELGKIMFTIQFLEMYNGVVSDNLKPADVTTCMRRIISVFGTNITRGNYENVLKFCYYGQYYWSLMGFKVPCLKVNKDNEPITFANQMVVLQLLPLFSLAMKYKGCNEDNIDDFRDQYVQKLFMMMCENTVRVAYTWRDFLLQQSNIFEIANKSLIYMMKSRKYYPRERAAIVFQSFIYTLKDVMCIVQKSPELIATFAQQIGFFSLLFDAFVVFIEEFQITWRDSVETICVMAVCFDFLTVPTWPAKLVVKALKLVNVSIVKYMSPNLALLVDRTADSTMAVLGPLLQTKLHDMSWEVRDSALEVICTISQMSNTRIEAASIAAPALIAWLQLMVSNWRTKQKTPSSNMVSFALKTSAWLATNEQRFNTLNTNKLVIKLTKISARESSTKRDYIALLSSMLEHKTGVELIIRCGFWERVLESSTSVEEASMFLSKFLEETVRRDLALSDKVVTKILVPLCDNLQGLVTEDVARLKYTLELINSILHYFLDGILMGTHDFQVVLIFLKHFHLEERASDYLHLTKISSVHFTKIMYVVQFLNWYMQSSNKSLDETTIDSCCVSMENNFLVNISEGTFEDILNLCEFGMLLWKLVEVKIITQQKNKPRLSFTNPVLFTLLWPQYSIMNKYFKELHLIVQEDPQLWHLRDQYENKLKGIVSLDIVRLFYFWRGTLLAHPNIFEISIAGLNVLKTTRKYFTNFQAGLVFQTLVYILQDVVGCSQLFPEKLELMQIETKYYAMVFEFISLLIGEFQITWTDSLETIDVLVLCFDHLSMVGWSPATVVQTLKLLNVAINKYMDPNLALLVDSTNDSTVASLGPLLYCKLNNDDVEVQKGALDVVNTMARISIVQVEAAQVALPICAEWIQRAVCTWSKSRATPSPNIVAFALNLTAWLSQKEERFCGLNSNNFFIKLINMSNAKNSPDTIKSAYINLLSSFLEHRSGIEFTVACNFWENVFAWSLATPSGVVEHSTTFMCKLLTKSVEYDEAFCDNVATRIVSMLGENGYRSIGFSDELDEEVVFKRLQPTLELIVGVLERIMKGLLYDESTVQVALVFFKNLRGNEMISSLMILAQVKSLALDVAKILFVVQFLELYVKTATNNMNAASVSATIDTMKSSFVANLTKGTYEENLKFCSFALLFWSLVKAKIPVPKQNNKTKCEKDFSNQFSISFSCLHYCILVKHCRQIAELEEEILSDDLRNSFVQKLINMLCEKGMRSCYHWRDQFVINAEVDLFKLGIMNLHNIKKTRQYFTKEQAVAFFQTFVYLFKDVINAMKERPEKVEMVQEHADYFLLVFDELATLIKEFQIKWTDSLESIDVLVCCFEFLSIPGWSTQTVVKILKLMNVATAQYMAPNLALLVDSTADSSVALLGPLVFSKLHDVDLEVKTVALELLCTVACMSRCKFPSLQKVLMDSELPTLVVKMSTCDGESFVRATAIKCLQEMIQVEDIWSNVLKSENLAERITNILVNETEGIVRVEAATFMCVAYEHQRFPQNTIDKIYETMIYASTVDLHWEVKVRALDFWDKVIKKHLQNQGMIDGSFPNVTFSKEHRKIMTLTDSEIRRRLLKVLGQLSAVGCLGVLVAAIKDDCDIEVSKTAAKITQFLVDLFKEYNVKSDSSAPTSPFPTENGGTSVATSTSSGISVDESMADSPAFSQHDLHDEVIDQIVNSNDAALLKNVYAPSDYGSVNNYDIQVRKIVTPNQFLEFTQQDLASIINEKKNWLNGIEDLGSLLDDILKTYEDDVNNMDCY